MNRNPANVYPFIRESHVVQPKRLQDLEPEQAALEPKRFQALDVMMLIFIFMIFTVFAVGLTLTQLDDAFDRSVSATVEDVNSCSEQGDGQYTCDVRLTYETAVDGGDVHTTQITMVNLEAPLEKGDVVTVFYNVHNTSQISQMRRFEYRGYFMVGVSVVTWFVTSQVLSLPSEVLDHSKTVAGGIKMVLTKIIPMLLP